MTITLQDGRKIRPGAYVVGDGISKADAEVVCSQPRWGNMTVTESEKPVKKSEAKKPEAD